MSSLWLKIKIWTKLIGFTIVVLYAFIFVFKNAGEWVTIWYWYDRQPPLRVLTLTFWSFVAGIVLALLGRTLFTTVKQIRQASANAHRMQLEKDVADMKEKSARLQAHPEAKDAPKP